MSHTNLATDLGDYSVVKEPGLDSHIREIRFVFVLSSWHAEYPLRSRRNRGRGGGEGGGGEKKWEKKPFFPRLI